MLVALNFMSSELLCFLPCFSQPSTALKFDYSAVLLCSVFSTINLGFCDFLTLLYTLFKKTPTEFEKYYITVMLLVIYCQDIFNHRVHCILGSKSIYCVLHRLTKAALVWY